MDGTPIDTVTSDGAGNWTTVQPTPLTDGPHTVTANTRDDAGNTATDSNTFYVDTTPPTVNIDTPAEGSTTSDTTPPITGTTDPNLTVIVYMDGTPIDTVVADGAGNWSTNQPTPLADGPHQVTAVATDPAGNTATDVNNFNVDTTPPVIDVTTPANGSVVTDNTPTYYGTTDPFLTVIVRVDGVPLDTVVADASGNWTAQQITPLADGPHTVRGTVTDSLGQTATDVNSFTIDTIAPSIIITSHPDTTVTTIRTPTICGTTESGSTVTLRIDGTLIGTTTANASGVWCVPVSTPLPEGPHEVIARATDPGGNPSADSVVYIVDLTPPSIVIVTPANGDTTGPITPIDGTTEPNITVIVYLDGSPIDTVQSDAAGIWTTTSPSLATGWHTAQGKAYDDAGNNVTSLTHTFYVDATPPAIVIDTPPENSRTNDNTPTYTGRTEPYLTVIVKVDGVPIDTVVADGSGNWTTTQPTPLPDGPHTVSATATDPYGNSATDTNPFIVDTTPPTVIIDTPADGSTTTDNTPLYTGRTEPNLTVIISVDGTPIDTVVADGSGNWSTPQLTPLADGPHTVSALATDPAGNTATDTNNFIVDTTPPPVTIDTPAPSDTTNDNTPDICGTSEAGARVIVKIDNKIVDTVWADAGGNWCVTPSPLTDGGHTITVIARDSAGNTTTYGPTGTTFRVNTKPTISSIGPSSRFLCDGDLNLTVTGTNFFSNSVIRLNGVSQATTFVDSAHLTTTIPAASLATAGTYSITVYTPPTGGGTSNAKPLTVDGATTSISGYVYWDRNISGTKDATEVGISGWVVSLTAPSPSDNQTTSTIAGGSYTFANLGTGSYTVTVSPATGWSSTIPASGSASYSVTCGSQTTGANFGYVLSDSTSDTTKYRTFTPASMLVKKPIKKVCHLLDWNFTFTNNTGRQAEALYVEFNNIVNVFYSYAPFTVIDDLGANTQDYIFMGATVDSGQSIQITGWSKIQPCDIRINKWWWIYDDSSISKRYSEGPLRPDSITKYLPMPNAANIRDEIFRQVFQPSGGMLVGAKVSPNPQKFAWVLMKKSNDLFVSLEDKTGKHTRRPRGFTRDVGESQVMRGKLPQLPPRKHNNRLFAEMAALRLNIAASISSITPNGLGVLIYDDGSTNPFNGMTISRIAGLIDTSLTYYRGRTEAYYLAADSTIRKINEAFYGDIDTISWSTELRLTGVKSVSEIPFLRPNPGAVAMTMEQSPDWMSEDEVPDEFTVHQNYPNPFNPTTTIDFYLPYASSVSVKIYDILGKEVQTLFDDQMMESGEQTIQFNASELSSGVYFYKISATMLDEADESMVGQTFVSIKKMVLLK
jgi:nickel-dependent lactate racemase